MVNPLPYAWSFNFSPDLSQSSIRSEVMALQFDIATLLTLIHRLVCFCHKRKWWFQRLCLHLVPWLQFFHCDTYTVATSTLVGSLRNQRKKICLNSCLSFLEWPLTGEEGPEAAVVKEKIHHQAFSSQLCWDFSTVFPFLGHSSTPFLPWQWLLLHVKGQQQTTQWFLCVRQCKTHVMWP